tara:strand:- start:13866 stop:14345 length:480 start_codon:yes stop_codon:yes gene_type:complete
MMVKHDDIGQDQVEDFLRSWKDGVIEIGIAYQEDNNYKDVAKGFIQTHYAFDVGDVLFKPTYTNDVIFRNNPESALSYFVSGDISEDSGFAIKPWEKITVSDVNVLIEYTFCAVMGILNLKPLDSINQTKIAFTFILIKVNDRLKIKVHHSSELSRNSF